MGVACRPLPAVRGRPRTSCGYAGYHHFQLRRPRDIEVFAKRHADTTASCRAEHTGIENAYGAGRVKLDIDAEARQGVRTTTRLRRSFPRLNYKGRMSHFKESTVKRGRELTTPVQGVTRSRNGSRIGNKDKNGINYTVHGVYYYLKM